jgi:hypothetical protein
MRWLANRFRGSPCRGGERPLRKLDWDARPRLTEVSAAQAWHGHTGRQEGPADDYGRSGQSCSQIIGLDAVPSGRQSQSKRIDRRQIRDRRPSALRFENCRHSTRLGGGRRRIHAKRPARRQAERRRERSNGSLASRLSRTTRLKTLTLQSSIIRKPGQSPVSQPRSLGLPPKPLKIPWRLPPQSYMNVLWRATERSRAANLSGQAPRTIKGAAWPLESNDGQSF